MSQDIDELLVDETPSSFDWLVDEDVEDYNREAHKQEISASWEELVSMAMDARDSETNSRWTLGDITLSAVALAGDNPDKREAYLKRFSLETAIEINTLRQYEWVSRTYSRADRNISPLLSWSHYRAAVNTEKPVEWLKKAADNDWSVAQLGDNIKLAKDNKDIIEGKPCSRPGCQYKLPLSKYDKFALNILGYNMSFCSYACLQNVTANDVLNIKQIIEEDDTPTTNRPTVLISPPEDIEEEDWYKIRQEKEIAYVSNKYNIRRKKIKPMILVEEDGTEEVIE
jgi:hypothetical protein